MKTTPNGNRYWLKEHQITAFWHCFGISNGLHVPIEYVRKHTYSKGTPKEVYIISPEFMRKKTGTPTQSTLTTRTHKKSYWNGSRCILKAATRFWK
jgi:hypothetical protein